MNDVWIKFIEQAPWAAAIIFTVYMFLKHLKDLDQARSLNAANMARERREHELQINNMWAVNIKTLVEKQDEMFGLIAQSLAEHEKASKERYEKMSVTKDLIAAVNADKDRRK
jgi:hypothetical protein